ncbi:MAG: diguanylate cyclase, partial [Lachnospiraceae bacterium]|nr:diguanylate cyclase [Lachnospiraceae bacterium]
ESFAQIVRRNVREQDVIARIGGDEVLGFYMGVSDETSVAVLTKRLNEQFVDVCRRLMGKDFNIPIGVSVGCVLVPEHGRKYDALFAYADKALYQVKHNGKHGYDVYRAIKVTGKDIDGNIESELAKLTTVIGERGGAGGALWTNLESFTWIYRFLLRFMKRYKGTAVKLLFVLTPLEECDEETFTEGLVIFGGILQEKLRGNDIITQTKPYQFFLLLPGTTEDNILIIMDRIMEDWEHSGYNRMINIDYAHEGLDFSDD